MLKKKSQDFDPRYIERMYDMGNRDGFGMMWVENRNGVDRVATNKSMMGPSFLKDMYAKEMDKDIAVHVRNATYGAKNLENCHPYCVLDMDMGHKIDLYMMHNGTIREVQVDKTMSDSHNFATKFLRGYLSKKNNYKQIYDPEFQFMLAGLIGPNKLVFLDNQNQFTIINVDMGSYHPTGVWVSTKNEIKLPEPVIVKHNTSSSSHHPMGFMGPHIHPQWDYENGEWEKDDDNRLHFRPTSKTAKKDADEKVTSSTTEAKEEAGGTDSGTQSSDIDMEGLEQLESKLHTMSRQDVYKFTLHYPLEATVMLVKLSDKTVEAARNMVKSQPWDVVDLMVEEAKKKHGSQTSSPLN